MGQATDGGLVSPILKPLPGQPRGSEPPETPQMDRRLPWAQALESAQITLGEVPFLSSRPQSPTAPLPPDTDTAGRCRADRTPVRLCAPWPHDHRQPTSSSVVAAINGASTADTAPPPCPCAPISMPSPGQPEGVGPVSRINGECWAEPASQCGPAPWSTCGHSYTITPTRSARHRLGCDPDQGPPPTS